MSARAIFLVVVLSATGCGGSDDSSEATLPTQQAALTDLSGLLKSVGEQNKKLPRTATELDRYEPIYMAACRGVSGGQIVYLYGNGITERGTAIIAYDAKAPTEGGPVLLENGEVKTMTAAEFAAAPKADKK